MRLFRSNKQIFFVPDSTIEVNNSFGKIILKSFNLDESNQVLGETTMPFNGDVGQLIDEEFYTEPIESLNDFAYFNQNNNITSNHRVKYAPLATNINMTNSYNNNSTGSTNSGYLTYASNNIINNENIDSNGMKRVQYQSKYYSPPPPQPPLEPEQPKPVHQGSFITKRKSVYANQKPYVSQASYLEETMAKFSQEPIRETICEPVEPIEKPTVLIDTKQDAEILYVSEPEDNGNDDSDALNKSFDEDVHNITISIGSTALAEKSKESSLVDDLKGTFENVFERSPVKYQPAVAAQTNGHVYQSLLETATKQLAGPKSNTIKEIKVVHKSIPPSKRASFQNSTGSSLDERLYSSSGSESSSSSQLLQKSFLNPIVVANQS